MRQMRVIRAIVKIDSHYHMNPIFASRARGINTDTVIKMMKIDPSVAKAIDRNQWNRLKHFIKE